MRARLRRGAERRNLTGSFAFWHSEEGFWYHPRVAEPSDVVIIEPSGSIRAGRALEGVLRANAGTYRLVTEVPGLLVLRSDTAGGGAAHGRVLMAGEIVSRLTVMEVINVVATANWRGHLHVLGASGHRTLSFDQGALKQAASNAADDRLGEILYRAGVVERRVLDELLRAMTADQRFGSLCVSRGIVDQKQLYHFLQEQAKHIFFSSLLVSEGRYLFVLPDEHEDLSSATVHVSVQGLLMEGVQRVDEMALFRDKIPSDQMCPELRPDAPRRTLEPEATAVLRHCDGRRSIEEIARLSGLGEFATTKAIYQLMQQGQLVLRSGPKLDVERVKALVARFNDVMQDIFMAVATYGGLAETRATLGAWIEGSGYSAFFGGGVDDFGCIDSERVAQALSAVEIESPLEGLHQALHELAAFALFSATTALPRDQELALARDVNARLKAIRIE